MGDSTTGTADEAAAARDSGTALRFEQMMSKVDWLKTNRAPEEMSVAAVGPDPRALQGIDTDFFRTCYLLCGRRALRRRDPERCQRKHEREGPPDTRLADSRNNTHRATKIAGYPDFGDNAYFIPYCYGSGAA